MMVSTLHSMLAIVACASGCFSISATESGSRAATLPQAVQSDAGKSPPTKSTPTKIQLTQIQPSNSSSAKGQPAKQVIEKGVIEKVVVEKSGNLKRGTRSASEQPKSKAPGGSATDSAQTVPRNHSASAVSIDSADKATSKTGITNNQKLDTAATSKSTRTGSAKSQSTDARDTDTAPAKARALPKKSAAEGADQAETITTKNRRAKPTAPASSEKTLVEIVNAEPASDFAKTFSVWASAIKAAGLTRKLNGKGPFTVFAPTDAAFDKLPDGRLAELMKPENKPQLVELLTYHIVSGKILAEDVTKSTAVMTLQGQELKLAIGKNGLRAGKANVNEAEVVAKNGVLHAIDKVLSP